MTGLRRITDGVLFQAVLTGSLSFSHIHDLAAAHGQSGWKAWLYPLSVDLLTVAAYRKLMAARRVPGTSTGLAWWAFLLGLAASLAANIISAWQNPDRLIAVALGVWPAVAFLVCTLLSHDPVPAALPVLVEAPAEVPEPSSPAVADTQAVPAPTAPGVPPVPGLPATAPVAPAQRAPRTRKQPTPAASAPAWGALLNAAQQVNAASIADTGRPAGISRLRAELRVGQAKAQQLRDALAALPADHDRVSVTPISVDHANGHPVLAAG